MTTLERRFAPDSKWTDERTDMLKRLWADGLSASQIAAELGDITRNAAIGKVHRLGLSGRDNPTRPRKPRTPRAPRARKRRSEIVYSRFIGPAIEGDPVKEILDADIPVEQRKTLLELTNETCRWPCGDPASPSFYFCGDPSANLDGFRPYCRAHAMRAIRRDVPVKKPDTSHERPKTPARRLVA